MKLHNAHPDNQQHRELLTCPLFLLVAQGDLCFSGAKAFVTRILFYFDFVGFFPLSVIKP